MKTKTLFLAALILPPILFFVTRFARGNYSRVPEKFMWFQTLDTTNGFKTAWGAPAGFPAKNRGTATLVSRRFLVRFEGETFTIDTMMPDFIGGSYQVDGRYGGLNSPDSEPFPVPESNRVTYSYSPRMRVFSIHFKTHRLDYRHAKNTLQIGERTFSTAQFLALSIGKDGDVQPIQLPPNVPLEELLQSYGIHKNYQ